MCFCFFLGGGGGGGGGGGSVCCWFVVRCDLSCLTNISQMKRGLFIVSLVGCE